MDILPTTKQAYDLAITAMSDEIQTLRAKVASAEALAEALREIIIHDDSEKYVCEKIASKALATYDKISEVKE